MWWSPLGSITLSVIVNLERYDVNIFMLDDEPDLAARYHCDQHVVKMILESAQIMSTVHGGKEGMYKPTHIHHPCTVWAGESTENYGWLYNLYRSLGDEYTSRYGKVHKSMSLAAALCYPPDTISATDFTTPAQAMPEDFIDPDPVVAYRRYYRTKTFARWAHSPAPHWW